jgi:hypothetical protein
LWEFIASATEAASTGYAASVFRRPAFAAWSRGDFAATMALAGWQRRTAASGRRTRGAFGSALAREFGPRAAVRARGTNGRCVLFDIGSVARFALFIAPEHENLA